MPTAFSTAESNTPDETVALTSKMFSLRSKAHSCKSFSWVKYMHSALLCTAALLLPYQGTLTSVSQTAVLVMVLVSEMVFHIRQWQSEFLKFKIKLLIQGLWATTNAHLQHRNCALLLSVQLWQCLPAKRDFKEYCSQSSPSSHKIKGTQQKKQSTPFSRAEYSCRILIHHLQETLSPTKLLSVMVQ